MKSLFGELPLAHFRDCVCGEFFGIWRTLNATCQDLEDEKVVMIYVDRRHGSTPVFHFQH
jgi:hypothetical protein